MATYYFDGVSGNNASDGSSAALAKKDIGAGLTVTGTCIFNVRRGTTVHVTANIAPSGTFTIQPYGDGTEKATIKVDSAFTVNHTGGAGTSYTASEIHMIGYSGSNGGGFSGSAGAALRITDCWAEQFQIGLATAGSDSYFRNCRVWSCTNGGVFIGNNGAVAPSRVEISDCYIDATGASNDAITYHDGSGKANGGLCAFNTVIGGNENSIDLNSPYDGVLIIGNHCSESKQAAITMGGGVGHMCIGNKVVRSGYEAFFHGSNASGLFSGNIAYNCCIRGSNAQAFNSTSTLPFWLYNNTFVVGPNTALGRMISLGANATGDARNNILVNSSSNNYVTVTDATAAKFNFSNNCYFGSSSNTPFIINAGTTRTRAQWQALASLDGLTQDIDSLFVSPGLDENYLPVAALRNVGKSILGLRDFYGNAFGLPPNIGAVEDYAARALAARALATRTLASDPSVASKRGMTR